MDQILATAKAWAALVGAVVTAVIGTVPPHTELWTILTVVAAVCTAVVTYVVPNKQLQARDARGRFAKGEDGFLALDMTPREWDWDLIVWPLWLGAFVVLELLGIFRKVPWTSLSRFSWKLESLSPVLPYVFLIGLAVLLVHIVTGFPGHRPW